MTTIHREEIREAAACGDLPPYVLRAYIEAGINDALQSLSPQRRADSLRFAADLAQLLVEPFDFLDFIPCPDGIREAL